MGRFDGKAALITGAGSGIGLETAQLLLGEGATVFAADLDPSGVPSGSEPLKVDVSDAGDMERMINEVGRIDVLCNNAGIGSTADPISCSVDEWDRLFSVNARGVFLGTKFVLPGMLERGYGSIVNTASVAGLFGLKDRAAYCASKGAVVAFTKSVAIQYADKGIRCNCVCPGTVESPWVKRLLDATDDPEATRDALIARQPLGRLARPDEIAKAIVYLASDDAAFVTGEALVIDGGIMAGLK
jgi:meso-butanediol dehydrogenase / (S,S)-butanediol dehydrogenase / diacetyl reductase